MNCPADSVLVVHLMTEVPPTILLASEGRAFSAAAIAKAADLATEHIGRVHVLSVARIWGSAFGLPHPSLKPSPRELEQQRDVVSAAMDSLKLSGISVTGEVLSTRNAAKAIADKATQQNYLEIVMTADAEPHWLIRGLVWTHEPYRVRRLAKVPVHLVIHPTADFQQNQTKAV
jgi:hypothetical protein